MSAAVAGREGRALRELRAEIEQVDDAIIALLAQRVALARETGQAKRALAKPIVDPGREAAVVARVSGIARDAGLHVEDVRGIYWALLAMSRRAQMDGMTACGTPAGQPIG